MQRGVCVGRLHVSYDSHVLFISYIPGAVHKNLGQKELLLAELRDVSVVFVNISNIQFDATTELDHVSLCVLECTTPTDVIPHSTCLCCRV